MNGRQARKARTAAGKVTELADLLFVMDRARSPFLRFLARRLPRVAAWLDERATTRYLARRERGAKRARRIAGRRLV